ncbi:glycosyltransferase family 2 protein [Ichthyenterobacterium sp. W332]|uniref:Glycosyltransferase family 2 protein n=1 Tax=Microcosmobacter mediterraneus TaxID=3075607 RepID=A0ABU2YGN9_9FLAO|nr:glycosyltransferase family 2 protein [Ichthyenterobacterium sp. W332]MDT0557349.1 glycosyltransferase family 2 protein [Ichthyenterobacterium sp. W332]
MKLSIIVPVYNGEKFINRAYQSIINQKLDDIAYEIIFVDNNSTDNSYKLIKELKTIDSKIRLVKQPHQGEANARNKGVAESKGNYVYQLDVDDEIYPDALRKLMAVLDNNEEIHAVFGKMVKSTKSLDETVKPEDETNEVILKQKPFWGMEWFLKLQTVVGEAAFMHRRIVFDNIGNYNTKISMGTDTVFDIELGMTHNVAFIDTYIYLYYKHADSITEQSKRQISQVFHLWSRLVEYHLPYYLANEVPLEYKSHLFNQLFSTPAKILYHTPKFRDRTLLLKQIKKQILPYKLTFLIRSYLTLMVYWPNKYLLKYYVYRLSKRYVRTHFDTF